MITYKKIIAFIRLNSETQTPQLVTWCKNATTKKVYKRNVYITDSSIMLKLKKGNDILVFINS